MQKSKSVVRVGLISQALAIFVMFGSVRVGNAGWNGDNFSYSVNASGTNDGYVVTLYAYSNEGSADASATADSSGVAVSGSVGTSCGMLADGNPFSTVHEIAFANASASADYTWDGPAGYPNGPEHFPIHISASISGSTGISGGGGEPGTHASGGGSYIGEASIGGDTVDGGHASFGCSGSTEGSVSGDSPGHCTYTVYGDWTDGSDDNGTPGDFAANARSGFSLEEDYTVEDQSPPNVQLAVQMASNSDVSLAVDPPGAEVGSFGQAGMSGSVSLTFGTPY